MEMEKVEKATKQFLEAWQKEKQFDINRLSVCDNITLTAKKVFYTSVLLRTFEIRSMNVSEAEKAEINVRLGMTIRGRKQLKQLQLYAVKRKGTWKIDIEPLMRH